VIRQAPSRFNPAQLIKTAEAPSDRFRVILPIEGFTRLTQLVGDYRLGEIENKTVKNQAVQNQAVEDKEQGSETPDYQFEAVFTLSRFSDSSFIVDADSGAAKTGASISGSGSTSGGSVGGGSEERAARTPIIIADGMFEAVVGLQCQRCLGSYKHRMEAQFRFAFAANEVTADLLPENMDPVLLDEDGHITAVDMFEDELLLRLPTHATHDDVEQCDFSKVPFDEHVKTEEELDELAKASKPENPFTALKGLKFGDTDGDENGTGKDT